MPLRWSPEDEELVEGRTKVLTKAPAGPGRLFGMGRVEVEMYDSSGGSVALRFRTPVLVLHGGLPVLLGHGVMEQYSLAAPLGALVPRIGANRVSAVGASVSPEAVADSVNRALQECAHGAIELFQKVAPYCADPADAIAVLPLGVYVSFLYRGTCGQAWLASDLLRTTAGLGVADLGEAMRTALSDAGVPRSNGRSGPGP